MTEIRTRFAPSPTGELHIGGLRTALFNYLYAKKQGGRFILRIEDTDRERYVEGAEEGIIDLLEWSGVTPDEGPHREGAVGPYRQSQRLPRYLQAAEQLIADGHAYKCFCTSEELDEMRKVQQAKSPPIKYDGRHRNITQEEIARCEAEGRQAVIRMRVPDDDEQMIVQDLVRGNVAFNTEQLDDQVLIKSDGFPTYHMAVVVDDNAMGITHIIRGEEWLPSTPKHLLLYRWLGYDLPQFVHLPLLLNDDRTKMSKRKGDVAAEVFRAQGYLADGLINFLSLLGWSPGDDREILSRKELHDLFSIERIGKAAAVFDRGKLDWMNQHYIQQLSPEALFEQLMPFLAETPYAKEDPADLRKIFLAVQPALVTLKDIQFHIGLFFKSEDEPLNPVVAEMITSPDAQRIFRSFLERAVGVDKLDKDAFFAVMKEVQQETQLKGKVLWAPMRSAITLEPEGPDLFLVVEVFGREKTLARIEKALAAKG